MAANYSTFIDPNLIPSQPIPANYFSGNIGTSGGNRTTRSGLNATAQGIGSGLLGNPLAGTGNRNLTRLGDVINPINGILPGASSIFNELLGGSDDQSFQPYIDGQGNYVWANPNTNNPVPRANVPGTSLKPGRAYRRTAQQTQALTDLLPYITSAVNAGAVPSAIAQYQASAATSPAYANLMTQIYNQYGPLLNQIGNEILRQNTLSQAETANQVLEGPGARTVQDTMNLQQGVDQPFYDVRDAGARRIQDLLSSIDLSGSLNAGERREVDQGLALEGSRRGTLNAPSATDTVSNAMRYGEAGHARQQEAKSNLAQAIQSAAAFLPASKSGIDAFQVATGRTSMTNPGGALFPGVNQSGQNSSFGLAGNILGNMTGIQTTNSQLDAQKKDWLDQFNQLTSGLANIGSLAGKAGGFGM